MGGRLGVIYNILIDLGYGLQIEMLMSFMECNESPTVYRRYMIENESKLLFWHSVLIRYSGSCDMKSVLRLFAAYEDC